MNSIQDIAAQLKDAVCSVEQSFIGTELYEKFENDPSVDCISYRSKQCSKADTCLIYGLDKTDELVKNSLVKGYDHVFVVNHVSEDSRIETLPLGILDKQSRPFSMFDFIKKVREESAAPSMLAYANFGMKPERVDAQSYLQSKTADSKFKVKLKQPGIQLVSESQSEHLNYLRSTSDALFSFCPIGNGLDTYRFWETLYLGRIPVVKQNILTAVFKNHVPILELKQYSDFDLEAEKLISTFDVSRYNFEYLTAGYWIQKIRNRKKT